MNNPFTLLRSGDLVDNQIYKVSEGALSNHRLGTNQALEYRPKKPKSDPANDDAAIWRFLVSAEKVLQPEQRKNALVLFGDQSYEHNADDDFISLHGTDLRNFVLRTGNVVGYVRQGKYALKVGSRFGDAFLRYMIADADGFLPLPAMGGEADGEGYAWLAAYLWLIKLQRAFRLGVPKTYVPRSDRLPVVRGSIDPVDYFLHGDTGKYLCHYREHSYQSLAAALFVAVYERLKKYPFLQPARAIINSFKMANQGLHTSTAQLLDTPPFRNPFYADYNPLIDLSKHILKNLDTDLGDKNDTSAFLFDVSMLFEYFVRKMLKHRGVLMRAKHEQRHSIATAGLTQTTRKLEPDIVFEKDGRFFVFDVKYKSYDFYAGVLREDLFQLHTYVGQYANHHKIGACGFIYPLPAKKWDRYDMEERAGKISDVIWQAGCKVPFNVFFLKIPDSQTPEFEQEMKVSCDNFLSAFFD